MKKTKILISVLVVAAVVCATALTAYADILDISPHSDYPYLRGVTSFEGTFYRNTDGYMNKQPYYGSLDTEMTVNNGAITDDTFHEYSDVINVRSQNGYNNQGYILAINTTHGYRVYAGDNSGRYIKQSIRFSPSVLCPFNTFRFTDCSISNKDDNILVGGFYGGAIEETDFITYQLTFSYNHIDGNTYYFQKEISYDAIYDNSVQAWCLLMNIDSDYLYSLIGETVHGTTFTPYQAYFTAGNHLSTSAFNIYDVTCIPRVISIGGIVNSVNADGENYGITSNVPSVILNGTSYNLNHVTHDYNVIVQPEFVGQVIIRQGEAYSAPTDIVLWDFLDSSIGGFMNTPIFGTFSMAHVFYTILGIGIFWAIIKIFAGG